MAVDLSKMRKGQEAIKAELDSLEKRAAAPRSRVSALYEEEELREMMNVLLKENQKLERRMDYLLNIISESQEAQAESSNEKLLGAMAQSQIEVLEQLAELHEKAEAGAPTEEIKQVQQETLDALSGQMKAVTDAVANLPYQQQMDALKKDIASIGEEMRDIEALVTTEAPEQVVLSINGLKADSDELRKRVDGLTNEIAKIGKDEDEILPQVSGLREMQKKVAEIDRKINNLSEVGEKISMLAAEMQKLERWMETYPATAAQQIGAVREMAEQQQPDEGPLKAAYEQLQERLSEMEKQFRQRELDFENRRAAEIKVILALLEKTEKQLLENEEASAKFKASVAALEAKAKALEGKTGEQLASELSGLEKHISTVEAEIEKEDHVESTHIDEIVAAIRDARENLKGAINQPVSPEAISKITEKVKELEMPEARVIGPEHKESLAAAEQALASAAEEAARNEKKALKEASSRISDVRQEIEKAGEAAQEAKKAVADVAQQAGSAVITDRKKLEDFVARLPAGKPVMLSAMASGLGMNPELVERTLIEMQKADPQHIVLQDTGYAARLLGKQATLTKK